MFRVINFWDDDIGSYAHEKLENFLNDYGVKKEDIVAINSYFNHGVGIRGACEINLVYEEREETENGN